MAKYDYKAQEYKRKAERIKLQIKENRIKEIAELERITIDDARDLVRPPQSKPKTPTKTRISKRDEVVLKFIKIANIRFKNDKKNGSFSKPDLINCPYCNSELFDKNMHKHLKKAHKPIYNKLIRKPRSKKNKNNNTQFIRLVSGGGGPGTGARR